MRNGELLEVLDAVLVAAPLVAPPLVGALPLLPLDELDATLVPEPLTVWPTSPVSVVMVPADGAVSDRLIQGLLRRGHGSLSLQHGGLR